MGLSNNKLIVMAMLAIFCIAVAFLYGTTTDDKALAEKDAQLASKDSNISALQGTMVNLANSFQDCNKALSDVNQYSCPADMNRQGFTDVCAKSSPLSFPASLCTFDGNQTISCQSCADCPLSNFKSSDCFLDQKTGVVLCDNCVERVSGYSCVKVQK